MYIYIYIYREREREKERIERGDHGVLVSVEGNVHVDPSSNP